MFRGATGGGVHLRDETGVWVKSLNWGVMDLEGSSLERREVDDGRALSRRGIDRACLKTLPPKLSARPESAWLISHMSVIDTKMYVLMRRGGEIWRHQYRSAPTSPPHDSDKWND